MYSPLPIAQLFFGVGVIQRKHGRGMPDFHESLARLASNALRRRIGGDQIRMFSFQILKLIHEPVEFGVADFGIVEYVVAVFMLADFFAEGFEPLVNVLGGTGHRRNYKSLSEGTLWVRRIEKGLACGQPSSDFLGLHQILYP